MFSFSNSSKCAITGCPLFGLLNHSPCPVVSLLHICKSILISLLSPRAPSHLIHSVQEITDFLQADTLQQEFTRLSRRLEDIVTFKPFSPELMPLLSRYYQEESHISEIWTIVSRLTQLPCSIATKTDLVQLSSLPGCLRQTTAVSSYTRSSPSSTASSSLDSQVCPPASLTLQSGTFSTGPQHPQAWRITWMAEDKVIKYVW